MGDPMEILNAWLAIFFGMEHSDDPYEIYEKWMIWWYSILGNIMKYPFLHDLLLRSCWDSHNDRSTNSSGSQRQFAVVTCDRNKTSAIHVGNPNRNHHLMIVFCVQTSTQTYMCIYIYMYLSLPQDEDKVANGVWFIPWGPPHYATFMRLVTWLLLDQWTTTAPSLHCEANRCESPWTSARDGAVAGIPGDSTKPQSPNCQGENISNNHFKGDVPNPSKPIQTSHENGTLNDVSQPLCWPKIVFASSAIPSGNFT